MNTGHYFHIILSRSAEILKHKDSLGDFSCEGKEAKNHLALIYAAGCARKHNNRKHLDVYFRDDMMTNATIQDAGNPKRVRFCKKCKGEHRKDKCPQSN